MLIAVTVIASFFFMEFIAWSNHKYIMHGFLWVLHRDHHENATRGLKKTFEKNDLFFTVYATPAIILIIAGLSSQSPYLVAIGAGFTLYGIVNFLVHDVIYHRRFNLFKGTVKNSYLKATIRAHDAHHKPKSKDDFNTFGLLFFPARFLKD
jgi:beta-carotene 3-hydroxylase